MAGDLLLIMCSLSEQPGVSHVIGRDRVPRVRIGCRFSVLIRDVHDCESCISYYGPPIRAALVL